MKKFFYLFLIFIVLALSSCKKTSEPERAQMPLKSLTINLDEIKDTLCIPVRTLNDCSSRPDSLSLHFCRSGNDYFFLRNITMGSDSNIFAVDVTKQRLIKFSSTGEILESIGRQGSGPGEFSNIGRIVNYNNNLYVSEEGSQRIQVFDLSGKYLNVISHFHFADRYCSFAINKRSEIITQAPMGNENLIAICDSLGNKIKEFGNPAKVGNTKFKIFCYNCMAILADNENDFLWCIYLNLPLIRKYDYSGNFLAEIKFDGKIIQEFNSINKEYMEGDSPKAGGYFYIRGAIIHDKKIIVNFVKYGCIEIDYKDENNLKLKKIIPVSKCRIIQKSSEMFECSIINNTYYFYTADRLLGEIK